MKNKLLLFLLLLSLQTTKVCSVPYSPVANNKCLNMTTEYLNENNNLCCKRCPPGHQQENECSETKETTCKPCALGRHIETWNFSPNCFSCTRCRSTKGLQVAQTCSSTTNSKCVCQPGKYCVLGFNDPYCSDCTDYTKCKPGFGVIKPGTLNSDVKCEPCPLGTFSNKSSYTEPCRPVSETTTIITTSTATEKTPLIVPNATTSSPTEGVKTSSVGSSASHGNHNRDYVVVIPCVVGLLGFLILVMILFCLYKKFRRKDSASLHPKVDANGNCETRDEVVQNYLEEMISFTITSPEQESLLEKGIESNDHSQSSITSETLPKADYYTGHEFISPLQPTSVFNSSTSALSEPMTLLSNTEPVSPQASIPTQCSSQPTSPQIISPVTNSPHVNVNITLHIGNGSCGSPSFKSTDLSQAECKLPFGKEEESVSTPQQEAGDLSKTSILERVYSNS